MIVLTVHEFAQRYGLSERTVRGLIARSAAFRQYLTEDGKIDGLAWPAALVLWKPNSIVRITSTLLKLDEDQTISEVSFERGPQGTQTLIHLMPKAGLLPQPFHPRPPIGGAATQAPYG